MLSAPNAGIVAPWLDGVSFFRQDGCHGTRLRVTVAVALARCRAADRGACAEASAATTKGVASPAPAAASGTSSESNAGADGGASSSSTNDADPPRGFGAAGRLAREDPRRLGRVTGQGTGSTTTTTGTAPSLQPSGTDTSSKVAATRLPRRRKLGGCHGDQIGRHRPERGYGSRHGRPGRQRDRQVPGRPEPVAESRIPVGEDGLPCSCTPSSETPSSSERRRGIPAPRRRRISSSSMERARPSSDRICWRPIRPPQPWDWPRPRPQRP